MTFQCINIENVLSLNILCHILIVNRLTNMMDAYWIAEIIVDYEFWKI